jgi:hypothetical protein
MKDGFISKHPDLQACAIRVPPRLCRREKSGFAFIPALLLAFFLLMLSCKIDHGLEPVGSRIAGAVTFSGQIPPKTDQVRVAVTEKFPPRDITELIFSDALPYREGRADYEIYLPPATYEVVAVIWKEKNQPWNISDVIGIYGGSFVGDLLIPTFEPVTVPDSRTSVEDIDVECNFNKVNRDAAIEGTITFSGTWPDNTGIVGIGAFNDIPKPGDYIDYYFKNVALDYTVPPYVTRHEYRLRVRSGETLKYIAVLWINDDYNLASITDLGFYRNPADPSMPGIVAVAPDSIAEGIDIAIQFNP